MATQEENVEALGGMVEKAIEAYLHRKREEDAMKTKERLFAIILNSEHVVLLADDAARKALKVYGILSGKEEETQEEEE